MDEFANTTTAFMKLFRGLDRAHGHFQIKGQRDDGKFEGRAITVKSPPTQELFKSHLSGEYSLGVVPITDEGKCYWGAIDIDIYPIDFDELQRRVAELGLPLVITRSKSDGAHLWLFLSEPVAAETIRQILQGWAAALGSPGVEVFPKQTRLRSPSDTGNWINLPYFGETRTLCDGGSLETFLVTAGALSQSAADLDTSIVGDAPPCLQSILRTGELAAGERNNGLFNFGVLFRQAYGPDGVEEALEQARIQLCSDLSENECRDIAKSVAGEKEYFYRCGEAPICGLCDKDACKKQKYGIGGVSVGLPKYPDQIVGKNGARYPATRENLEALMEFVGITASYNVITKRIRVTGLNHMLGDEEAAIIAELTSLCARYRLPKATVGDFIDRIAKNNLFNPVVDWLEGLPSAEGDPVKEFVEHCGFENPAWATIAWRRWFVQAVAAADHAESSPLPHARSEFPYVLVLAGPQGVSKTSLMYGLLGSHSPWFTAGRMLDTANKDSLLAAVGNWIVELGEIDSTFRRSDIAALKAFLTDQRDEIRKPYARAATLMARRTAFFATVNESQFLRDDTGNRRFWPVCILSRIHPLPDGLADRLWSWAWQSYRKGEQWWLTEEEESIHQKVVVPHEEKPIRGRLLDCYDFSSPERIVRVSSTEILDEIGWPNGDRGAQTKLGRILRELGIQKTGNKERRYLMPSRTLANRYNREDLPLQY